ncbi:MAG TPA: hypothetical protein VMP03_09850 [Methylomirabilota bacterium]|nr:hypothetical protein [Methylomirabilota bacterium]
MTRPTDGDGAKAARAERLAAQLRENLKRRKAQARSRRAGNADPRSGLDEQSGDTVAKPPESADDVTST